MTPSPSDTTGNTVSTLFWGIVELLAWWRHSHHVACVNNVRTVIFHKYAWFLTFLVLRQKEHLNSNCNKFFPKFLIDLKLCKVQKHHTGNIFAWPAQNNAPSSLCTETCLRCGPRNAIFYFSALLQFLHTGWLYGDSCCYKSRFQLWYKYLHRVKSKLVDRTGYFWTLWPS